MRAMERRFSPLRLACTVLAALGLMSCTDEPTSGVAFSLDDPLGILDPPDGVVLMPAELRLVIFPETSCDPATGRLTPEPDTTEGAPFADAVVDVIIPLTTLTGQSFPVPAGTYTILVRGRGVDRVTTEPDQVIASGCATDSVTAGGTKGITITLREVTGMGTCGNSTVSPDEQCDDGNTADGDGCSASCRTEAFPINIADVIAVQQAAGVAWGAGAGDTGRAIVAWQTDTSSIGLGMRFLGDTGGTLPAPFDRDLRADNLPGTQLDVAVAVGGGRVLLAYQDVFRADTIDVRVRSFRIDAPTEGGTALTNGTIATEAAPATTASAASTGTQAAPAVAVQADGNGIVVFENPLSATGISGRIYAPTATVGSGASAFDLGAGSTGATSPVVAATSTGFLVAYLAGASVLVQAVDAAGTASAPVALGTRTAGGTAPLAIGSLTTCAATGPCALVAWEDAASATGIDGAVIQEDGTEIGSTHPLATSGATGPTVSGGDTSQFVVAWTGADGVHARVFDTGGMPALNHERPQTSDAFLVAPGGSAPSVSAGGRTHAYLVVWNDPAQDPSGGVRGRTIPF